MLRAFSCLFELAALELIEGAFLPIPEFALFFSFKGLRRG